MNKRYFVGKILKKIGLLGIILVAGVFTFTGVAEASVSVSVTGIQREYLDQNGNNIRPVGPWKKPLYLTTSDGGPRLRLRYVINGAGNGNANSPNPSCIGTGSWSGPKNNYTDTDPIDPSPTTPGTYYYGVRCTGPDGSVDEDHGIVIIEDSTTPPPVPSINFFTADRLELPYNNSGTTIRWSASNATSCTASGGANGWSGTRPTTGTFNTQSLNGTTTYYLTCYNGSTSTGENLTIVVETPPFNPNPTINFFTADDTSIDYGDSTRLRWSASNASYCNASGGANGWSGIRPTASSFPTGSLFNTTTYNITCYNNSGKSASDSVSIFVDDDNNNDRRPTVELDADDTRIDEGDSTFIEWNIRNNPDRCTASGGAYGWSGDRDTRDGRFYTGRLYRNTTYRMTCSNSAGSGTDSITIRVDDDNNNNDRRPTVTLDADRTFITRGSGTYLDWSTRNNPDYCTATGGTSNWYGAKSTRGNNFYTGPIYSTTTFRLVCENNAGSDSDTVTIRVESRPISQPPQNFNRPTISLTADHSNLSANGSTTIRWNTTDASLCTASGGSFGWPGIRSVGSGAFFTGSLTGGTTRTYTLTCSNNLGSTTDRVAVTIRPPVVSRPPTTTSTPNPTPTSIVLMNSSVNRNQPIIPTIDNTNPRPGDEINYTVGFQNIGTGSIRNLNLRMDLPFAVEYLSSTPNNPTRSGNTLIFNLGTLGANSEGAVSIRVRVRDNVPPGTNLNFPAVLTYTDPAGQTQSVNANISAQVWFGSINEISRNNGTNNNIALGANVFRAGVFFPGSILGWLLLVVLILVLMLLAKYLYSGIPNGVNGRQHA